MHGWSDDALVHELIVVPRRAFTPWSGTEVIDRPGWLQLVTPSFRRGGLNEVVYADLGEHEADAQIDAAIARYRELELRFRWTVTPDSRPEDLGERLERRGLERTELIGMVAGTADVGDSDNPDIEVERVDARGAEVFIAVMAAGWGVEPGSFAGYVHAQLDDAGRAGLYLARHRGRPAAAAACMTFARNAETGERHVGGSLHLQGGVVLPEFRQRGLYRALTAARLRDASARGIEVATTHAKRSTSAPLLERFGFRELVTFASYSGR
jgi:GNAT superfamily N-acetyltransferase